MWEVQDTEEAPSVLQNPGRLPRGGDNSAKISKIRRLNISKASSIGALGKISVAWRGRGSPGATRFHLILSRDQSGGSGPWRAAPRGLGAVLNLLVCRGTAQAKA